MPTAATYWTTALTLLVHLASANPAIITSVTEHGYYDVSLNIKHVELLPGLQSWEDLAFTSLTKPRFSEYHGNLAPDVWEKLAVLDIASGTLCQHTVGCMENVAVHHQALHDLEHEILHHNEKRFRYIGGFTNKGWVRSTAHALGVGALQALADVVSGSANGIIQLSRSAVCASANNGNQGCLSWSGGAQAIKKSIAQQIISSAQGTFGGDAVSGEEYNAAFEGNARKVKRDDDVCVSNRPNGCT